MEDTLISSGDTLVLDLNISVARNFRWALTAHHRNIVIYLYHHDRTVKSKARFKEARNHSNSILESAKFIYATEKGSSPRG